VIFSVRDSGVGIKPETMPLLFQKFSRCSDASKSNIHGTGLGLYVAKRMLEAHNGRIWAESEGESKGSQFYVELDLVK
jgi:signal transduction histidine kinase